jgi:hypothetical protein
MIYFLDINECTNETICGNGSCINTIGSYTCNCSKGYEFNNDYEFNNGTCVGRFFFFVINKYIKSILSFSLKI